MENMGNKEIKAVIFDMDGVLIDTEKHYCEAWQQAAREAGFAFYREHALMLRSCDADLAQEKMQKIFGESFDYFAIRDRRRELVKERLEQYGLEKKPGIDALLSYLHKKGIKTAVATATPIETAKEHLTQVGIYDLFDRVVSAKQVTHGKPAPDVYLYACSQIAMKPESCIAVEDSPNGILSAYRAGCRPVMVPDLTQPDEDTRKLLFACVKDLTGLTELV